MADGFPTTPDGAGTARTTDFTPEDPLGLWGRYRTLTVGEMSPGQGAFAGEGGQGARPASPRGHNAAFGVLPELALQGAETVHAQGNQEETENDPEKLAAAVEATQTMMREMQAQNVTTLESLEGFKETQAYSDFKTTVLQLEGAQDVNHHFHTLQRHGVREESFLNVAIDVCDRKLVRHLLKHHADRRYKVQGRDSPLDMIVQNYNYEEMDVQIIEYLGKDSFRAAEFPLFHVMRICPDNAFIVIKTLLAFAATIGREGELVPENLLIHIIDTYVNNDEGVTEEQKKLSSDLIVTLSTLLQAQEYPIDHGTRQVTYQTFEKLQGNQAATDALLRIIPEGRLQDIIRQRGVASESDQDVGAGGAGSLFRPLPHQLNSLLHSTLRY